MRSIAYSWGSLIGTSAGARAISGVGALVDREVLLHAQIARNSQMRRM
jgi:hypothetical protein